MGRLLTAAWLLLTLASQVAPKDPGAALWIRMQVPVSSRHATPGSPIEAIVVQPFEGPGDFFVPAGSRVRGRVAAVSSKRPASIRLAFDSIVVSGRELPLKMRVTEVDNAREHVSTDGTIIGLDELRKRPGKVELLLLLAAHAHPVVLATLETSKIVVREVERPQVCYPAGTDLALAIDEYPQGEPAADAPHEEAPVASEKLTDFLADLPQRTQAKHPPLPSDWINLAFIGSRKTLDQAFHLSGWQTASELSLRTEARTFFAVAEQHAYRQAPVSTLLVFDREPDLVYQKQTNTFAKRHHIRIWSTGKIWNGQAVWIAAATHDIGIDFSEKAKTFTHRVDPEVDLERTKVMSDLRFTGSLDSVSFVPRPSVGGTSQNATGDAIRTDGRLAVLTLSSAGSTQEATLD